MLQRIKANWTMKIPLRWGFKAAGAGFVMTGLVACGTAPNDNALFQSTGRVVKDAPMYHVMYTTGLHEIGREYAGTVPIVMNNGLSQPPVLGRCFYKVVIGTDYTGTRLVEDFVERRCPNHVVGFTPAGPFNRY